MSTETCFVIMAIGDQDNDGVAIFADELKQKYNDLIKEALLKARPNLEVIRSDEVTLPGTITTDIFTRLMHSTFVVADITYPNPNVFYELGLRHACRTGTFIIRDKQGPAAPFDVAHLRHIEYENSTAGLKVLSDKFKYWFEHYEKNPQRPDNQFLELAKLTLYQFLDYAPKDSESIEEKAFMAMLESPELVDLISSKQQGEAIDQGELMRAMQSNPKFARLLLSAMAKSGSLSFKK